MTEDDPRIERTRARVVEAVLALLLEEGPESLTHQRVAEKAGVGRATIYRHWPERWDLILGALETLSLSLKPPAGLAVRESLILMLEELCDRLESPAALAFSALIARADWDQRARELLDLIAGRATQAVADLLEEASSAKGLRFEASPGTSVALVAGPFFFERFILGKVVSRAAIPAHVDALLARRDGGY